MSFNKSLSIRRKEKDIFKLRAANFQVDACEQQSAFQVVFLGPKETPFQLGKWRINLYLPDEYPYKSPSVGFQNRIFHPNIDYSSGSVCLDVINQTWTPMYELVNIFQVLLQQYQIFLPQLLTYPNPASPMNHQAATLFTNDIQQYNSKVRQCIEKHALNEKLIKTEEQVQKQTEKIKSKIKQVIEQDENSVFDDGSSLSDHNSLDENNQLNLY